ncbi:hypothetical protein KFK09_009958 [Dendrobium nobile]|uniref:Uncharacterized protein n=1 Tax=Dendrobium nobile TaxID=94219 RepID=A0A8T3BP23_DENNO|nr:hypothetical protein KFK09_009958 [Dendrobium nobile]
MMTGTNKWLSWLSSLGRPALSWDMMQLSGILDILWAAREFSLPQGGLLVTWLVCCFLDLCWPSVLSLRQPGRSSAVD